MTDKDEALKLALEALEKGVCVDPEDSHRAIYVIREALAQPQQEPVKGVVTQLRVKRNDLQRLVDGIKKVVHEMDGAISVTEAVGALELAKLEILKEQE